MSVENTNGSCLLCDKAFDLKKGSFNSKSAASKAVIERFKQHLLETHRFVISDISEIADLFEYIGYWKLKLQNCLSPKEYLAVIKTNSKSDDIHQSEEYFMLCPDVLPEDKSLRERLHAKRLQEVLEFQEKERKDEMFSRQCLLCRKVFTGNIRVLLNHLAANHNLSFGLPDNLVFVNELLDLVESKLKQCICLYCEKIFKDRDTLREHMRKKHHKRLNPNNKEYDKYYIVNYLHTHKSNHQSPKDDCEVHCDDDIDENETWDDWREDEKDEILCLFCIEEFANVDIFTDHLKKVHHFDWNSMQSLNFYEKIKLINYIRKSGEKRICCYCQNKFDSNSEFVKHINIENETFLLPNKELWDLPEFYFPALDNDAVLSILQDPEEFKSNEDITIIPE